MKVKIILFLFFTVSFLYQAIAQKKELPGNLSLKEAQKLALENNPGLRVKSLNAALSKKQVEQARWERIPDIYANYDVKRNLIIPTTPVPAKAFNPDAPEGKIMPLKFMTNWTSNAGLNAKVDLFNPQTHGQIREAKQKAAISRTDKEIASNNLRFKVGEDYGACMIAEIQLRLAVADTVNKNKILKMTQEQYEAGRLKITDLNLIASEKSTALSNYLKAKKILANARLQLTADLGYTPSQKHHFILTDSISGLLSEYKTQTGDTANSLSLKKWNQQKALTEIQLQNTRATFLPTVSLNGFYGTNFYDNDFDLFNSQNWYGNSYVGVSIKLPLTEGLDRVKKIEALQLQSKSDQSSYQEQLNQVQLDKLQAMNDLLYKERDLFQKKKNMERVRKTLQATTEQFENGRLLSGDWAKSNFAYQQAKTAYLQAAYDFIVAKMKLEKVNRE